VRAVVLWVVGHVRRSGVDGGGRGVGSLEFVVEWERAVLTRVLQYVWTSVAGLLTGVASRYLQRRGWRDVRC
jgi:hypothetical protein